MQVDACAERALDAAAAEVVDGGVLVEFGFGSGQERVDASRRAVEVDVECARRSRSKVEERAVCGDLGNAAGWFEETNLGSTVKSERAIERVVVRRNIQRYVRTVKNLVFCRRRGAAFGKEQGGGSFAAGVFNINTGVGCYGRGGFERQRVFFVRLLDIKRRSGVFFGQGEGNGCAGRGIRCAVLLGQFNGYAFGDAEFPNVVCVYGQIG